MDVHQKLDEIAAMVRQAKSMPMSASCVVNRSDLLARLDEVREALPGSLAQAQEVLGGREQVVADAQQEAEQIVASARAERGALIENTQVVQEARAEAARLVDHARREAETIRTESDDYVDSKLANFEVVLGKTIDSVDRGRDKLLGRDIPAEQLLDEADAYVDAQFSAIEAVLRKTLDAVGRGREKLTGHRPLDELGEEYTDGDTFLPDVPAAPQEGPTAPPQGTPPQYGGYYSTPSDGYRMTAPQVDHGYPEHAGAAAFQGYEPQPYAGAQGGYPVAYPQQRDDDPYANADPYGYGQGGGQQMPYYPEPSPPHASGAALDETSLFDTGMIDAEQLRRYEQGR